jgi:DNA-binding NarL/FixJ family response regulator
MTPLTPRQLEIAILLARGWQGKQIAFRLAISRITVTRHTQAIYDRCGIHDRVGLVFYLVRKGVIHIDVEPLADDKGRVA